MLLNVKSYIQKTIQTALHTAYPNLDLPPIELESSVDPEHGQFSSNIALKSAKIFRKSPVVIAEEICEILQKAFDQSEYKDSIDKIEVKTPGFINFFLSVNTLHQVLHSIYTEKEYYGTSTLGNGEKIQIEFVSANPTGPLSVAHARQAVVGDVLGNILAALDFNVTKEYYVNDGGNQIRILGESIRIRAKEILGESVVFPEEGYQGEYIKDMAKTYLTEHNIQSVRQLETCDLAAFGAEYLLAVIKEELLDFGVHFDVWSHESKIATPKAIEDVLAELKEKKLVYEHEGAQWFKSTQFGDDKDRVVQKSDGFYTYLTPDIVYHRYKYDRGFSRVFNIWGPDHHGYIPRIKAAAQALGKDANALEVLIVQLATIYRDGQEVSMSTRKGQFISLREVMEDVGVDASRYFFLMRHIKAHLEFDLDLAKKQSSENPVYYIQYAHARVFSINAKAKEAGIAVNDKNFNLLNEAEELDLIRKLGDFQQSLIYCYDQLDPYPLVIYMQELATLFHKFYDRCRILDVDQELAGQRLGLSNAARIVLANGLRLLGVSQPESM